MQKKKSRAKITLGSEQSKVQEIPMPDEVMEKIFDESVGIWYETQEESEYRQLKEDYNKSIIKEIRKVKLTDRQKQIFDLMFREGLTLTETARKLNEPITTIQMVRDTLINRIRKYVKYSFKINPEDNE